MGSSMHAPSIPTTARAWRLMTCLRRCARRGSRRDPTARTAALSMRVWPVPVATADGRSLHCGSERLGDTAGDRSEEHTSELQSLMRISYAVFCLKKKKKKIQNETKNK